MKICSRQSHVLACHIDSFDCNTTATCRCNFRQLRQSTKTVRWSKFLLYHLIYNENLRCYAYSVPQSFARIPLNDAQGAQYALNCRVKRYVTNLPRLLVCIVLIIQCNSVHKNERNKYCLKILPWFSWPPKFKGKFPRHRHWLMECQRVDHQTLCLMGQICRHRGTDILVPCPSGMLCKTKSNKICSKDSKILSILVLNTLYSKAEQTRRRV